MERITSSCADRFEFMASDGVRADSGGGSTGRRCHGSNDSRMCGRWAIGHAEGLQQDGLDEWERFAPAWHAGFGALALLTAVLVAIDDELGTTRRYVAFGLVATLAAWYALRGARALRQAGAAYVAAAAPLTLALFAAAPIGAVML